MIKGINPGEYIILIGGEQIDTAYGDQWTALAQEEEWHEALKDDVVSANLDRPFSELIEDDDYWLNGYVKPLRLEDEPIPFQGEPVAVPERVGERGL